MFEVQTLDYNAVFSRRIGFFVILVLDCSVFNFFHIFFFDGCL